MRTIIQIKYTGKVARISHVHSVSNCCNRRTGIVFTCLQILIENIVAVVGSNETLHGQSHFLSEQSCGDISEVSARYTDDGVIRFSDTLQLSVCIEIIKCLRQETGYIDGIGRSQ